MQVKFWGTRGSIPVPGADTVRYGGNTSCVEVRSAAGTTVIIDCGTGLRVLGQQWMTDKSKPIHGHILLSHTHWDHIQGLPFFLPLFMPGYEWDVYGPKGLSHSIKDTLSGQMQYSYFPVGMGYFNAIINYHDLLEGVFYIDDIKVSVHYLNHTALDCGFKLEVDGCVVVYYCDHEPYSVEAANGDIALTGQDQEHAEFAKGADLLIHDAQYTPEEYAQKIGWGHSTAEYVCKVAEQAGVKRVALTHHEPTRTDKELDAYLKHIKERFSKSMPKVEIFAAQEGQAVDLNRHNDTAVGAKEETPSAVNTANITVPHDQSVLVYSLDPSVAELFIHGARANNILVNTVEDMKAIEDQVKTKKVALFVIEHSPPRQDAVSLVKKLRKTLGAEVDSTPIVVVSSNRENRLKSHEGISENLVMPLSQAYVQTKMLTWLLRVSCRWQPAPFPENEKERLSALHRLNILDTEQEERFDRITRLAATLFSVPAALISFIDADRQWFKSVQGPMSIKETTRDMSFCAHAVYENKTLIINDTTLDDRFADNPLVAAKPHIRFYAGAPLILKDGYCMGTLCIADVRPRVFDANEIKLLEDMRDMVVEELSRS